ncbi:MAG: DUF167 domain-containing protein [Spirochaetales bacterium]|nr:DUF167 domain-containing protein [Spirochaetales bacterium]MCF7938405.1 DUF167 domain-containing protein [Spirochaetales bacterium]
MQEPKEQEVAVKAITGSRTTAVNGFKNNELVIKVAAPPERGKANKAIVRLFAAELGVSKSDIRIIRGEHSRHKLLRLSPRAFQAYQKFKSTLSIN